MFAIFGMWQIRFVGNDCGGGEFDFTSWREFLCRQGVQFALEPFRILT